MVQALARTLPCAATLVTSSHRADQHAALYSEALLLEAWSDLKFYIRHPSGDTRPPQ